MKKSLIIGLMIVVLFMTACTPTGSVEGGETSTYVIEFEDDLGNLIQMDKPATRIISLYSAHTENIYALQAGDRIIGVGTSDAYPYDAVLKPKFSYRSDPEKVIAAEPDLVLIRPFIQKSYPDFVQALVLAKVPVVCLYPNEFEEFDGYITKLAMLTGQEEFAEKRLVDFHQTIDAFEKTTASIEPKTRVYFESTETEYRTITPDSTPAKAIQMAGGVNIAADAVALSETTSIASYGDEKILEKADEIDVFVSQRGAMNAGGNYHSISIRPGFDTIKALREHRVFEINEKLVSSPSFRFEKGIQELARMFYPEIFDDLAGFDQELPLTRKRLAELAVRSQHRPIFAPTSSYYRKEHKNHTYGAFTDVTVDHPNFDMIETASLAGYVNVEGEAFDPDREVTREEFATTLYLLSDLSMAEETPEILDLDQVETPRIIQILVGNGMMEVEDGYFYGYKPITEKQAMESIMHLEE